MLKKFLGALLFFSVMFISSNTTHAQDVWVYSDNNVTVYVDDTTYSRGAGDGSTHVYAKWVSNLGELLKNQEWYFYADEGYLTAWIKNQKGINIAKGKFTAYDAPVENRPDLVAIYNWIQNQPVTHTNNQMPKFDEKKSLQIDKEEVLRLINSIPRD